MAFTIRSKVTGLEPLLRALDAAGKNLKKKGTRKAVGAAGKIILKAAKSRVRRVSGLLARSLGRKVKVYRGSGVAVAIVGPRKGYKQEVVRDGRIATSDPIRYAHLVERGTMRSQALPFLQPALDSTKTQVVQAMGDALASVLPGGR